ncbi:MAG: hypothetical protein HY608_10215 [Planctomycetes bacterium]|nr:hypothetical protein [Planctomycetota bacterium]
MNTAKRTLVIAAAAVATWMAGSGAAIAEEGRGNGPRCGAGCGEPRGGEPRGGERNRGIGERIRGMNPERKQEFQERRQQRRADFRERFQNASPEERREFLRGRHERRGERRDGCGEQRGEPGERMRRFFEEHPEAREKFENASPEQREEFLRRMRERMQERRDGGCGSRGGEGRRERLQQFLQNHPKLAERLKNMDPEQRREILQRIRERRQERRDGGDEPPCRDEGRERLQRFLGEHPEVRERLQNACPEEREEILRGIRQHILENASPEERWEHYRRMNRENRNGCGPEQRDEGGAESEGRPRPERHPRHGNHGVRDHGEGEGRDGHGQGNGRGHGPEEPEEDESF